jgi:SAM-dependent methyltransferase
MNDRQNRILDKIKSHFDPDSWTTFDSLGQYDHAGLNLINEINDLDPDLVIDAGCGHNRFKGHIKNLVGFDINPFPFADLHAGFDEVNFRKECADVVLALGSIHFIDRETVESHLDKAASWVKPGGFLIMRVIHQTLIRPSKIHYFWSDDDIEYFSKKHSLDIYKGPFVDHVDRNGAPHSTRKVWWWKKQGTLTKYKIDPITTDVSAR